MSFTQVSLRLTVYAPALMGGDGRKLAIVHGMERVLPGLRLEWTTSEKEDLIALPSRDEWLVAGRTDNGLPFLCNDDESRPMTLTGWENPNDLAAGSPPRLEVHATLPLEATRIVAAVDVLEALGEGARAVWGHASPRGDGGVVAQQFRHPGEGPHAPPKGLPALALPEHIRVPEIPHYLGWLNYWSNASSRALGFPDPSRDAELLFRSRRTATGGWVVRLTDAPLDLDNPAHLVTLLRTYERFPEIGGRSTP